MFFNGSIAIKGLPSRFRLSLLAFLAAATFGGASSAFAQAADAPALDQDCPPPPPLPTPPARSAEPCITLDARRSVDSLAGAVIYRWKMGDGQVREGLTFDYCYAKPGRYVIELDVTDPVTGEVRQHETEEVVDFTIPPPTPRSEPALRFTAPERARVGEAVSFQLTESELPPCLPSTVRFNWNFRDGLLAQGRTVTHTFRRAGTFTVRLAIDGSGIGADCLPRNCVSRQIIIEQ
jgi:PKD domain